METPVELRRQAAPRNADVPASLTIDWPALDQADIDAAREETSSQALVTGLHRPMPSGYQGDLLEDLRWTDSGQRRQARIQLTADGAESIRVRFRASLPAESSLTFLGTHNEDAGLAPPVWSQSELASRQADSVAIWSPSGQAGELGIVVDVPADADLTGHFLVFETISHRWASVPGSALVVGATPKHDGNNPLECPLHYVEAACYTSEYPSDPQSGDMRGMVVHIHFESGGRSYLCSGATIAQRGVARQRILLLTAHQTKGDFMKRQKITRAPQAIPQPRSLDLSPHRPTVEVVNPRYQPSKAELEADLRVNATFEESVKALTRPVNIRYIPRPKKS